MSGLPDTAPRCIAQARLPRWCLPAGWPQHGGAPALADLWLAGGRIARIAPSEPGAATLPAPAGACWNVAGAPVLPALVEAHAHIDKAFTLPRLQPRQPGLLGAIDAMAADRQHWTAADVHERASRALQWAFEAGVATLRTHCDWWQEIAVPPAWHVLQELSAAWAGRIALQRVALIPLPMFNQRDAAHALARTVAASGPGACLGGFVHTTNWNPQALRHLLEAAEEQGLDVDLHCDEELAPEAQGLAQTAALARAMAFSGRVVCGHNCALAAQPEAVALATLDAVAAAPITLVTLPATNLLLQDAQTGRTPRQRGITLVHEARARGIALLVGGDNVQDAFCASGSFDPVEALAVAALAARLDTPFDAWSDTICRADRLARGAQATQPLQEGAAADLVLFSAAGAPSWPARAHSRVVLRAGRAVAGTAPAAWLVPDAGGATR